MLKKALLSLLLLLTLFIAALATVLIQPQLLLSPLKEASSRFAGFELNIDSISSHTQPLRLDILGLTLHNPAWPDSELLSVDSVSLQILETPFQERPFWRLKINAPQIIAAKNTAGEFNWMTPQLSTGQEKNLEKRPQGDTFNISTYAFSGIDISDLSIIWREANKPEQRIDFPRINADSLIENSADAELAVKYQQQLFKLRAKLGALNTDNNSVDFEFSVAHKDIDLNSHGQLYLNRELRGSNIKLSLAVRDLSNIAKLTGGSLPKISSSQLHANITINPDYQIQITQLKSGENEISGELTISADQKNIDASLRAKRLNLNTLTIAEEESSTVQNKTSVSSSEAQMDWAWLQNHAIKLNIDVQQLIVSDWQVDGLELASNINDNIKITASANKVFQQSTSKKIHKLKLSGSLKPLAERTKGPDVQLALDISSQEISGNISGLANLNGNDGNKMKLKLSSEHSAPLWALADLHWQEAGALSVSADIDSSAQRSRVNSTIKLGEKSLRSDLTYQNTKRPKLTGNIDLRDFDINFMNPEVVTAPKVEIDTDPNPKPDKNKIFSRDPLALQWLKDYDAELQLQLSNVTTPYNNLIRGAATASLGDGVLRLRDGALSFAGDNHLAIDASIDHRRAQPKLKLQLTIDGKDYGKLGLSSFAAIDKGRGKLQFKASSVGNNVAEIAGNLDAKLDIKIINLEAQGNALNIIGSDILSETIDKLNPFSDRKESTKIECLAVHFGGDNGKLVSEDGIALETAATKIIGTGKINLAEEKISFGVSPIARKGVGVNIGAAASLVRLEGSLAKPKVVADPKGMFTSSLATGAAIYTGGLSVLAQGLIKRALYSGSACDGDLTDLPGVDEIPEEILRPAQPAEAEGSASEADTLKSATDKP